MHDWNELLGQEVGKPAIGRDESTLTEEEWQAIDGTIVEQVRQISVFREVLAPLLSTKFTGAGWTEIKAYRRGDRSAAVIDMSGEPGNVDIGAKDPFLTLAPIVHAESLLYWRQRESAREGREPLDLQAQREAAEIVAQGEDSHLALGDAGLSTDGWLNPTGNTAVVNPGGAWSVDPDNVYTSINEIETQVRDAGFVGDLRYFVDPENLREARARFTDGSGGNPIRDLVDAGILRSADDIVGTSRQTHGVVTAVPLNQAYSQWHLLVDVTTEELVNPGKDALLSTWTAQANQFRRPAAIHRMTGN